MESGWKKVARALRMKTCFSAPRVAGEVEGRGALRSGALGSRRVSDSASLPATGASPRDSVASTEFGTTLALTTQISGLLRLSKSGSRSSKKTCAICMEFMKTGDGLALFTAECSHVFHFQCIATNVSHGNLICPVCRANWKELPFQGPVAVQNPHGGSRVNPVDLQQNGGHVSAASQPFASGSFLFRRQCSFSHPPPEPNNFNDDDPLDESSETANDSPQGSNTMVEIMTYTEFLAVPSSSSLENFNVLIHLKAPNAASQSSHAPIDLVTVLDISGSMAGTKITLLKHAMGFLIQNLGPSDRLSVVSFSSTAHRLFPLRRMSESGRQMALEAVDSVVANGGTNIAEGLRKGVKVIEECRMRNPVCRIILLSDGQDNTNIESPSDYSMLVPPSIRDATSRQIQVHAFGFGSDHDAAALHSISEISGGTFSFVESGYAILDSFAQCIGGLLSVMVQEMQLFVNSAHPGVQITQIESGNYNNQVADDARSGSISVGDLYDEEERNFLILVNVPKSSTEIVLLKVGCTYKDPISKEAIILEDKEVKIERPEVVASLTPSVEVDRECNRIQATKAISEAKAAADRGALSEAVSILEEQRKKLSDSLASRSGDSFCMSLDDELSDMQERMASWQRYETCGRAYMLSGMSSHSWQRATARLSSTEGSGLLQAYQTRSMTAMLHHSQTLYQTDSQADSPSQP